MADNSKPTTAGFAAVSDDAVLPDWEADAKIADEQVSQFMAATSGVDHWVKTKFFTNLKRDFDPGQGFDFLDETLLGNLDSCLLDLEGLEEDDKTGLALAKALQDFRDFYQKTSSERRAFAFITLAEQAGIILSYEGSELAKAIWRFWWGENESGPEAVAK